MQLTEPAQLFERWITQLVSLVLIHWIVIYSVDKGIKRFNNWGQVNNINKKPLCVCFASGVQKSEYAQQVCCSPCRNHSCVTHKGVQDFTRVKGV